MGSGAWFQGRRLTRGAAWSTNPSAEVLLCSRQVRTGFTRFVIYTVRYRRLRTSGERTQGNFKGR
jgi:hypothetical protein